jgi:hypothetical protein
MAKGLVETRKDSIRDLVGDIPWQEYNNKYNLWFNSTRLALPYEEATQICEILDIPVSMLQKRLVYSKTAAFADIDKIKQNWEMFMKFLGFWMGDGWIDWSTFTVSFSMGVDPKVSQPYVDLINSIGLQTKIRLARQDESSSGQCNIASKHLCLLLKKLGFETGSLNKRIPQWVYSQADNLRTAFLMGYIDADGCDTKGGAIQYCSINLSMVEDFLMLIRQLGWVATNVSTIASKAKTIRGKETVSKELYQVKFYDRETERARQYTPNTKKQRILSVKLLGKELVYDIEVDNDLHNFVAENIIISNCLLEDAMLSYRISRAPDRRAFYVDTTGIPEEEEEAFMEDFASGVKRSQIADSETGRVEMRYNPTSVDEDFFIPVRGKSSTRIEPLPGGNYVGAVDDVKYLRDKLFSAIKIPQEYLSRGEGKGSDQTALAQKDIRFSRTVQRLQRDFVEELRRVGVIHLYLLGYTGAELVDWSLSLNNPSKIAELQNLEHIKAKFAAAAAAGVDPKMLIDSAWVYDNILAINPGDIETLRRGLLSDKRFVAKLAALEKGADNSGGAAGGMVGDAVDAGLEAEANPEMAAPTEGGAAGEVPPAEEDTSLLTAPGKKSNTSIPDILAAASLARTGISQTKGSKGHDYMPTNNDQRISGAFKRSNMGAPGQRAASGGGRNLKTSPSFLIPGMLGEAASRIFPTFIALNADAVQVDEDNRLIFIAEGNSVNVGFQYASQLQDNEIVFVVEKKYALNEEKISTLAPELRECIKYSDKPQYLIKARIQ